MIQCRDIDELMVDFLYQELDEAKTAEFQAHVDGCPRCGAEVTSLTRTRQALRALPEADPSPAVSARLLHEASKRAAREEEGGGIFGFFAKLMRPVVAHPAWAAAATALLIVGAAGVLSMGGHMKADVQSGAAPTVGTTSAPQSEPVVDLAPPADKPRELPAEGYKADETAPKVAAPAVAATAKAPDLDSAGAGGGEYRGGRAATEDEAKKLQKTRAVAAETARAKKAPDIKGGVADAKDNFVADRRAENQPVDSLAANKPKPTPAPAPAAAPAAPPPPPQPQPQHKEEAAERAQGAPGGREAAHASREPAAAETPAPVQQAPAGPAAGDDREHDSRDDANLRLADKSAAAPPAKAAPAPRPAEKKPAANAPSTTTAGNAAAPPAPEPTAPAADAAGAKNEAQKQQQDPAGGSEQLYQQARQQASSGRCTEALTLSRKISKTDPDFYRRRVAGDPALNACNPPAPARAKGKAAPQKPSNLQNDKLQNDKAAK